MNSSLKRYSDATYTDGDVLGSGKEPVDQDTHERSVQTIFNGDFGKLSVSHALRHDNGSNGDTGDKVSVQPLKVVAGDPVSKREDVASIDSQVMHRRGGVGKPFSNGRFLLDKGVGTGHGEDRFTSGDLLGFLLVVGVQLDT